MTHEERSSFASPTYLACFLGFAISAFLTLFSFWYASHSGSAAYPIIIAAALIQLAAQLFFFLHLGKGADRAKNITLIGFTLVIVLILVVGTLWIMNNLAPLHMLPPTTNDLYTGGHVAPQNELK